MFKILIYGFLLYLAYRMFLRPLFLQEPRNQSEDKKQGGNAAKDGDYIDYEEVK